MSNASMTLETKYGTLTLTFLDPDVPTGNFTWDGERRVHELSDKVAQIEGSLTINRVPVRVCQSYTRRTLHAFPGSIAPWWKDTYNRREGSLSSDLPDGVRNVLWKKLTSIVQEAYLSRPDLQHAAKVQTQRNAIERAERDREKALGELRAAEQALRDLGVPVE